jgi:hypothetical protein
MPKLESEDSATDKTSINSSLLFYSSVSNSPSSAYLKNFPLQDNPCSLRLMGDSALYWLSNDSKPFTITFPGLLSIPSRYPKVGPYFNLNSSQPVRFILLILPMLIIYFPAYLGGSEEDSCSV